MITLYHLDQSRSGRIIWLLEELGLAYRLEVFLRQPDLYGPAELQDVHALGRAPVIRDEDVLLAESGAIVEYLIARHGQGRLSVPPSQPNFPRYLYWLHYAEGSLMLQLLREWSLDRMMQDADSHRGMARVRAGTKAHLAGVETALTRSSYIAGNAFTAADIIQSVYRIPLSVSGTARDSPGKPSLQGAVAALLVSRSVPSKMCFGMRSAPVRSASRNGPAATT